MLSQPYPFLRDATLFTAWMGQPSELTSITYPQLTGPRVAVWSTLGQNLRLKPRAVRTRGIEARQYYSFGGLEVASWRSKTKPEPILGRVETETWEKEPVREQWGQCTEKNTGKRRGRKDRDNDRDREKKRSKQNKRNNKRNREEKGEGSHLTAPMRPCCTP